MTPGGPNPHPSQRSAQPPSRAHAGRTRASPDRFAPRQPDPSLFELSPTIPITRLEPDAKRAGHVIVRTGRKRLASIDAGQLESLGVRAGSSLDERGVERLLHAQAFADARRYARRVVAARAVCVSGLVRRLTRRGLAAGDARRIADELVQIGAINDAAFAEVVARATLARRPAGRSFVVRTIVARGVERAVAEQAARRVMEQSDTTPHDDAFALAQRKARTLPRSIDALAARRRVFAALARRGFAPDVARTATERALRARPTPDADAPRIEAEPDANPG